MFMVKKLAEKTRRQQLAVRVEGLTQQEANNLVEQFNSECQKLGVDIKIEKALWRKK